MLEEVFAEVERSLAEIGPRSVRLRVAARLALVAAARAELGRARGLVDEADRLGSTLWGEVPTIAAVDALGTRVLLGEARAERQLLEATLGLCREARRRRGREALLHALRVAVLVRGRIDLAPFRELGRALDELEPSLGSARLLRDAAQDLARLDLGDRLARAGRRVLVHNTVHASVAVAQDVIAAIAVLPDELLESDLALLGRRVVEHPTELGPGLVHVLAGEAGSSPWVTAVFEPVVSRLRATNPIAALWVEVGLAQAGLLEPARLGRLCDDVFEAEGSPAGTAELIAECIPAFRRVLPDQTTLDLLDAARERAVVEGDPGARIRILSAIARSTGVLVGVPGVIELSRRLVHESKNAEPDSLAVADALLCGVQAAGAVRAGEIIALALSVLSTTESSTSSALWRARVAVRAAGLASDNSEPRARARRIARIEIGNASRLGRAAIACLLHEVGAMALGRDHAELARCLLVRELDEPPGPHRARVLDELLRIDDGLSVSDVSIETALIVARTREIFGASPPRAPGVLRTGYLPLDDALADVGHNEVFVIAGRPQQGVERIAAHALVEAAQGRDGRLALLVTRQEPESRWRDEVVAAASGIPVRRIRERAVFQSEARALVTAHQSLGLSTRVVRRAASSSWLEESMRVLGTARPSIIVVEATVSEVDELVPSVVDVAKDLGVPAVLAVQLSAEPPESAWDGDDPIERSFAPTPGEVGAPRGERAQALVYRPAHYADVSEASDVDPGLLQLVVWYSGADPSRIVQIHARIT